MSLVQTSTTWTSITLTKNEIWIADNGDFKVHCFGGTTPTGDVGGTIRRGDSVRFEATQTVWHRAADGETESPARFTRIEVSA